LFFGTLEPRKNVGGLLDAYERLIGTAKAVPYNGGDYNGGDNVPHNAGDGVGHPFRGAGANVGHPFRGAGAVPELILAGRATDEAKPWLDRISRPPLRGAVRHIGYVDANDRRALFEGARLLVQPSFDEGFGMPVLEAMSLGVPVVAANRGALPEVLGGAGLLVDPDQAADIAHAIGRMLDDRRTRRGVRHRSCRAFRWDDRPSRDATGTPSRRARGTSHG
jgi:glycosyltransferase involved in cell wall biosynthesis